METGRCSERDLKRCRVLVTPTSYGKDDPRLKTQLAAEVGEVIYNPAARPLAPEELCRLIQDVDGYIAGLDTINAEVIAAAQRLKIIARYGVGVDRVNILAATARGILVTNTPGANSAAVAELAIGLMLALARDLPRMVAVTRQGEWPRSSGVGLRGKTVGLIGFGAIGSEVAVRLQAFGCRILAYDPYVSPAKAQAQAVELCELGDLLGAADFVSLHTSVGAGTTRMVNREFLAGMKPGAFLINTARGELIDEAALFEALRSAHLRGAALDCFSPEPPAPDNPLLHLPQVIATPHAGAHTDEATAKMGWMALESCLSALRGECPEHLVNPEAFQV